MPPAEIHKSRRADLRFEVERFIEIATPDDVFDLLEVLYRYKDFMEYNEEYRPDEILKSAAQAAIDREHALLKVKFDPGKKNTFGTVRTLAKIAQGETWLADLLEWIAKSYAENPESLTPCNVAAHAQKQQAKFDAEVAKARAIKRDFPKLVA